MKSTLSLISRLLGRYSIVIGIVAAVAVLIAGSVMVFARDETFPGTAAPGAHEFWDRGDAEAQFCTQCHEAIATEMVATATAGTHPITSCFACHPIGTGGHAAGKTKCVDCHGPGSFDGDESAEITSPNEAHAQIMDQLGETTDNISWTCKACHTKVDVAMTTVEMGPLELVQDKTD